MVAVVLLGIIMVLAGTVNSAIELYKQNKAKGSSAATAAKTVLLLIGLLLLSNVSYSQIQPPAKVVTDPPHMVENLYFYLFSAVIAVEVLIILFFIKAIRFLTGLEKVKAPETGKAPVTITGTIWQKINQFRPLEDEDFMDTGHNYDGIRELDNITPPWFTAGFIASIIFAIVYLYRYEVVHSAPSQLEEYAAEVKEAKVLQDSLLKLEGNKVDENSVAMLGASDIEAGAKIFSMNCLACHGDKGQGVVGPNLTDDYWIHGGSIKDVFKSVKYGWAEKGMKAWKDDFSPTQIAQLASFIKSLRGTNPAGAKEKQGELYVETNDSKMTASATTADSVATK
jgi:cytochrome c oxidase cbb3-type subunit 3